MTSDFNLSGVGVPPGERVTIDLPVSRLHTHTQMTMPVQVIHGRHPGPRLFVCAAIHGDEINGVEIIHRLLHLKLLNQLRGVLVVVPVVNVFGFIEGVRYLPDRRDLNRSFPGSEKGSFAARLANLVMESIVANCTHGIDLHTGSNHRSNLPQIRACLDQAETTRLAHAFGVPVIINANTRDGSLRQAALEADMPMLLYEGGEALRFNEFAIRAGLQGIVSVMRTIGMLPTSRQRRQQPDTFVARSSTWIRAPQGGILHSKLGLGDRVQKKQPIGLITDLFGENEVPVRSSSTGVVIGRLERPLVNEGEALFHVARFADPESIDAALDSFSTEFNADQSG